MGCSSVICLKEGWFLRICINYSQLNEVIVINKYHIPRIDNLFDQIHGVSYLSKIDM